MKYLLSGIIALSLFGTTASFAQNNNQGHQGQRQEQRNNNDGHNGPGAPGDHNGQNRDRSHWSRGDRLPEHYRQNSYVANDWQQHNLRRPPRGYHWVRNDDNDYVLAAITTGIIADIVMRDQYENGRRWSRGERLSDEYRGDRYVVSDWRGNHLRNPGRGRHWVRVNNQFILVAIGSGQIADAIIGRH
jgi:Ni/Co efflux regulator RcnB